MYCCTANVLSISSSTSSGQWHHCYGKHTHTQAQTHHFKSANQPNAVAICVIRMLGGGGEMLIPHIIGRLHSFLVNADDDDEWSTSEIHRFVFTVHRFFRHNNSRVHSDAHTPVSAVAKHRNPYEERAKENIRSTSGSYLFFGSWTIPADDCGCFGHLHG